MSEIFWLLGTPLGLLCLVGGILVIVAIIAVAAGGVYVEADDTLVQDEWWKTDHGTQF